MDYVSGKTHKAALEISDILAGGYEGKDITMNGAIHTIRDMGDVAFIILRKREGLVQAVYERNGEHDQHLPDLKNLKEASAVEVSGTVKNEERVPNGFEIRLKEMKILSEPKAPMPIPINKWKLDTTLEKIGRAHV